MRIALTSILTFLALTSTSSIAIGADPEVNGKTINLTAPCMVSKNPDNVFVTIGTKKFLVELPEEFQRKFPLGERAWVGLVGKCHLKRIGIPGRTAEHSDGYIDVDRVLFYDQKEGHERSLTILKE